MKRKVRSEDRRIAKGLEQYLAHKRGELKLKSEKIFPPEFNVRSIREQVDMSQTEFAERYSVPLRTLQEWEQGRRKPDHMAKLLLLLIAAHPKRVEKMVHELETKQTVDVA